MITQKKPAFMILLLLISFGSISAVLFTPGLPAMAHFFGINNGEAQLTITLYLIGYALGQLLYGPIANRFGRKAALLMGISLQIIASMICIIAPFTQSFALLVLGRLLMALGASVGLIITYAMVADVYCDQEARKMISYLMVAFAIMPGLGLTLGGFLTAHFGWQSCFSFLILYGLVVEIASCFLPETLTQIDYKALQFKKIIKNYLQQMRDTRLLLCAVIMGCSTSFVYGFAALAPFIALNKLHISADNYGLWNLLPPVGMIAGSLLSAQLTKKIATINLIRLGIIIAVLGIFYMAVGFGQVYIKPVMLFAPMILIYVGLSLVVANSAAMATINATDKANASAMLNFINLTTAVIAIFIFQALPTVSIMQLPIAFGLLTFVSCIALVFLNKKKAFKAVTNAA